MRLLIIILLIFILFGGFAPWYPYNRHWGYAPFGGAFVIILIVLLLLFAI